MFHLKKNERLLKRTDFNLVQRRGRKVSGKYLAFAWAPSKMRRIGIIASSRSVDKAVVRNRIKRIVREFFRLNKETFPLGDCVVIARNGAGKLENEEIRKELERLISKFKAQNPNK